MRHIHRTRRDWAADLGLLLFAACFAAVSSQVAGSTGQDTREAAARARLAALAGREREVALAVGRGLSNAEIAKELHLALPTVKTHVSRILTRLDLNNRVQIALLVHDANPPRTF